MSREAKRRKGEHPLQACLITVNVGSIFDKPGKVDVKLMKTLMEKVGKVVNEQNAKFVALHLQECARDSADIAILLKMLLASKAFKSFVGAYSFFDATVEDDSKFSALGSICFVHRDVPSVARYNYNTESFSAEASPTQSLVMGDCPYHKKTKFKVGQFGCKRISRKGYLQTGWRIGGHEFQLINVHLFADINNNEAARKTPSSFAHSRHDATIYMLEHTQYLSGFGKQSKADGQLLPSFYFGDFNYRLSLDELIPHLCSGARARRAPGETSSRFYSRDTKELLLNIETKKFEPSDIEYPYRDKVTLMEMDHETTEFSELFELAIDFPPTYPLCTRAPFSPTRFSTKRAPAWCDRVLLSETALELVEAGQPTYNSLCRTDIVGDHKPVILSFNLGSL